MRKPHTKMWQKIAATLTIAMISAIAVIYVTYFRKPSTEEILSNNRRASDRMSRKALGQNGKAQSGSKQNIDVQIAHYQAEKWEAWLQLMNYVSVGNLYDKCEGEDRITIGQIVLLPDKEYGGVKTRIYSNFTLHEKIADGEIHMQVKYNDVQLFKNHWPLCEAEDGMEDKVIHCPLQPGRQRFVKNMKVPNYLPKGKYTTRAWAYAKSGQMFGCAFCEFVL